MGKTMIYWRVSIRHYDFTKTVICKMTYGYYRQKPEDMIVKNTGSCGGWTEIKFFNDKQEAQEYVSARGILLGLTSAPIG